MRKRREISAAEISGRVNLMATWRSNCCVGAIGEEDGGHAALSDFADEAVGADEGAGFEALEAFEGGAYRRGRCRR